ncbi:MAG: hypothetical protein MUE94_03655 [Verrucomicrobia bacterium]|jgi:hypothetical protein|nr:hypothetical protein [Verrucomicrobiota bacterium]
MSGPENHTGAMAGLNDVPNRFPTRFVPVAPHKEGTELRFNWILSASPKLSVGNDSGMPFVGVGHFDKAGKHHGVLSGPEFRIGGRGRQDIHGDSMSAA